MAKLPSFQFYPGDWMKDANLRRCSKAAVGVWIDMICLMFECEDRGVFQTGGEPWTDEDIAAAIGGDIAENLSCIAELLRKGVAHRNSSGAIFSRRLVREEQIRQERSTAGKQGGRPRKQNESKTKAKENQTAKQNRGSSSSSSISSSNNPPTPLSGGSDLGGLVLSSISRVDLGIRSKVLEWAERNIPELSEDLRVKILACSVRARAVGKDPPKLFLNLVRTGITENVWRINAEDEQASRNPARKPNSQGDWD